METQSERIQRQIDAANTKLLESKRKLVLAIHKEKAEKYDLFVKLFSDGEGDEKGKFADATINGEKAIDFINRKIDEELEAIAAEEAAKKEAAKAAKEQKAEPQSTDSKSETKDNKSVDKTSTSKNEADAKEQSAQVNKVENPMSKKANDYYKAMAAHR